MTSMFNGRSPPPINRNPEPQGEGSSAMVQTGGAAQLCSWVTTKVDDWRKVRDLDNLRGWDTFYRLWRGFWSSEDKTRTSERSKIVCPALSEAIDLTHAQIVEAVFGRDRWFDLPDDVMDEEKEDVERIRDLLDEDLNNAGVPDSIQKVLQIGTLYGTGVAKLSVDMTEVIELSGGGPKPVTKPVVRVYPLDVREVVPDPASDSIDTMLGIAHETLVPLHEVKALQRKGFYLEGEVGTMPAKNRLKPSAADVASGVIQDATLITEYHGLVPKRMYLSFVVETGGQIEEEIPETDDELVETITTIANGQLLLRCKLNPAWGGDRALVAYQHEAVPGEFWGRGVAEKGFNAQCALDGTVRMRLDAGALAATPMVACDRTRLPKGFNYTVHPGKEWPTVGNPNEVVMGFNLGQLDPNLFAESAELEKMVRQGTGAMDPGTALSEGARRDTAAGTAMMAGGMVKRAKRTMYNIENQLLQPLLRKIVRRYVQFAPDRYPQDITFSVKGAMGIMAREYEQSNLSQLYMQTTPEEGPVRLMLLREIFNTSSSPNKVAMTKAIDKMLAPPSEEAQAKQKQIEELQLRKLTAEVNELENKALNQGAQAAEHSAKAQGVVLEASLKDDELIHDAARVKIEAVEAQTQAKQVAVSSESNDLKREQMSIQREKLSIDREKLRSGKSDSN